MGRSLAAGLFLLFIVVSTGGSISWSQPASTTIYIVGVNDPESTYAFHLTVGSADRVVVRNSRLAGLYVEVSNASGGPDTYVVEIVNSTLDYILVSPDNGVTALHLVTVKVNSSVINTVTVTASRFEARRLATHMLNASIVEGLLMDSNVDTAEIYVSHSINVSGLSIESFIIRDSSFAGAVIELHNVALECNAATGSSLRTALEGSGKTSILLADSRLSCTNRTLMIGIDGFHGAAIYNSSLGSIIGYTLIRGAGSGYNSSVNISESTITGNLRVEAGRIRIEESRVGEYWPNGTAIRTVRGLRTAVYLLLFQRLHLEEAEVSAFSLTASGYRAEIRNSTIIAVRADFFIGDALTVERARLLAQGLTVGFSFHNLTIAGSVIAGNIYVKSARRGQSVTVRFTGVRFTHASKITAVGTGEGTRLLVELYNSTVENSGWVFSAYSDPLKPASIRLSTGRVYWASPLGPTVIVMGRVERKGGATLSIVSPKASLHLDSWMATPLGPMVKPCKTAMGLLVGPGEYASGSVAGRCALILDAGKLTDKIWIYSTRPLRVEVHGLRGSLVNATVEGNTTINLPSPVKILFIYFKKLPALPEARQNATRATTTTHHNTTTRRGNATSTATAPIGAGGVAPRLQAPSLLIAVVVVVVIIGYYLYTINKSS